MEFSKQQPTYQPTIESLIAGAIFDFVAWLTTREETLFLGCKDDATPAVEAIKEFAGLRALDIDNPAVRTWHDHIGIPKARRTYFCALTADEGFHLAVQANIAMLLHDRLEDQPGSVLREPAVRNGIADEIIHRLFDPPSTTEEE